MSAGEWIVMWRDRERRGGGMRRREATSGKQNAAQRCPFRARGTGGGEPRAAGFWPPRECEACALLM